MEKAILDATNAAITAAVKEAVPEAVNEIISVAINNAIPVAINTAVPAAVQTSFATAIDLAVKERIKEIDETAERKLARSIKAARLEAKVSATTDLCFARYCSLGSMAPAKLDWIMRINEQDREKIQGWNSELCQIYHEENEEKAQEKKKREQIQP